MCINFSGGYKIHLFKLTPDGKQIIAAPDKVIHQSEGSEANKLYKNNGLYYHFFSEVIAGGSAVIMERAKNIFEPYMEVKQHGRLMGRAGFTKAPMAIISFPSETLIKCRAAPIAETGLLTTIITIKEIPAM